MSTPPTRWYNLASSTEWQKLERLLSLNTGFAFVLLLVPNETVAAVCSEALTSYLFRKQLELIDLSPKSPDGLRHVAGTLLDYTPPPNAGVLWISRAISEGQREFPQWRDAWFEASARLNQFRNLLTRQLPFPLIFAGADWLLPAVREAAPDLWSIRATVVHIDAPIITLSLPPAREVRRDPSPNAPDPALAMREVSRLGDSAGEDQQRAMLLFRAGQGYAARDEYPAAVASYREALEVASNLDPPNRFLAELQYHMARALLESYEYGPAADHLSQAISLYAKEGDMLSFANCMRTMGDLSFALGDYDRAVASYNDALSRYEREGDIRGQANSIRSLSDVALVRADYSEAHRRLEAALPLYHRAGDLRGEASCIRNMGAIAFDLGNFSEAEERYQQALPLYQRAGAVRGEARCIRGFGEIALVRGAYHSAATHLNEALKLYRQIGAIRGEAACLAGLGEVALALGDRETANGNFKSAYDLYLQAKDFTAVFSMYRKLMPNPTARATFLRDIAGELTEGNHTDLLTALRKEFPDEI